jgi:hypothetical protein
MGRIIVANRRGHQVVEWNTTDTEEARATVEEAERILREVRAAGCAISKKVDGVHVRSSLPSPAADSGPSVQPATARGAVAPRVVLTTVCREASCAAAPVRFPRRLPAIPPGRDTDDHGDR